MRILICGATGLLGRELAPSLEDAGHAVASHGFGKQASHQADLTDPATTRKLLTDVTPDAIINLVALTNVDACERDPSSAIRLNMGVALHLARYAASGVRLIHISSDQVYSGRGPHLEDAVCPINVYGLSKYAGERPVLEAGGVVLRTNFLGRSRVEGRRGFVDWAVESLRTQTQITLATDVLAGPLSMTSLVTLIGHVVEQYRPGCYNLGTRDGASKRDLVHGLARRLDLSLASASDGLAADLQLTAPRPQDMRMQVERFERAYEVSLPSIEDELDVVCKGIADA